MEWINELFKQYEVASRGNPFLAAMILPIIGGIMFYMKNVPKTVYTFLLRTTTVTMSLNNAGYDGNLDAYNAFDRWFMESGYQKFSRSFFMFRRWTKDPYEKDDVKPFRLGIGNGLHIFFYKRRLFWFVKGKLSSTGSEREKEEIIVRTFGWSQDVFVELVDLFNQANSNESEIGIHKYNITSNCWEEVARIVPRNIDTFCMNAEQKEEIIEKIHQFFHRKEWYRRKGLTHKASYLFYGPPGTGKTTLSKLLAGNFKKDLYILSLNAMTDERLISALSKIKPGSFLLMEDVDQAGSAVRDREKKKDPGENLIPEWMGLSMSGMLNAFDGVIGLDNLVIIMTTNHPDDLDKAIRREGRIDKEYLIDELATKEIWNYALMMYDLTDKHIPPDPTILSFLNSSLRLPGCAVESAFKENPEDPYLFIAEIKRRYASRDNRIKEAA